jgi:hypothetical protein
MFIANEVNPFAIMIIRKALTVALLDAPLRLALLRHVVNIAGLRTNFRQSTNMQCYKGNNRSRYSRNQSQARASACMRARKHLSQRMPPI